MSTEYILKSDLAWETVCHISGFCHPDLLQHEWFFPPIVGDKIILNWDNIYAGTSIHNNPSVCGCDNSLNDDDGVYKLLDNQYIYNPRDFSLMKGKAWKHFRRNIHKWYRENKGKFQYRKIFLNSFEEEITKLILSWSDGKEIYDNEVFVKFMLHGTNRYGLYYEGKGLIGVNVFDYNHQFINYRYCIDNGEPFMNKLMRYLFYTSEQVLGTGMLVNDGGNLDNPGLKTFKERLQPVQILKVYSYTKET